MVETEKTYCWICDKVVEKEKHDFWNVDAKEL